MRLRKRKEVQEVLLREVTPAGEMTFFQLNAKGQIRTVARWHSGQ